MAINPETQYPGKIAPSSPAYPYGQARNITVPGDGTGTPWEAAIVNDMFGWQQALLDYAAIVPSGTPDQVGSSQYLAAIAGHSGRTYDTVTNCENDDSTLLTDGMQVCITDPIRGGIFVVREGANTPNGGTIFTYADNVNKYVQRVFQGAVMAGWFDTLDNALAYTESISGELRLAEGANVMNAPYIVDTNPICITGSGAQNNNPGQTRGSYIDKQFDGDLITVTNSLACTFMDFSVVGNKTTYTGRGIVLQQCGRSRLQRVTISEMASHGIEFNNGNITSFEQLILVSNGGWGLFIDGASPPDTNACVISSIDARGNTLGGVNIEEAYNVFGTGITCQQNIGPGIRLNKCRQSMISMYLESNAANLDLELTNDPQCAGNILYLLFQSTGITDNSAADSNMIFRSLSGAQTIPAWDLMQTRKLRVPFDVTVAGDMSIDHPSDAFYRWYFGFTGQKQSVRVKNVGSLGNPDADPAIYPTNFDFQGAYISRRRYIFTDLDTTPDISLSEFWLANNSAATTITNFVGGDDGMIFTLLANNGNTTLQHNGGGVGGIFLKAGANETLNQYETRSFVRNGIGWWIEV